MHHLDDSDSYPSLFDLDKKIKHMLLFRPLVFGAGFGVSLGSASAFVGTRSCMWEKVKCHFETHAKFQDFIVRWFCSVSKKVKCGSSIVVRSGLL